MDSLTLANIQIYRYALPLNRPFPLKGKEITQRDGLILRLSTAQGKEGLGEIAPLPGMSDETFEEALSEIQTLRSELIGTPIPEKVENLDGRFDDWFDGISLGASVRFGIEMAVLNLLAHTRSKSLCYVLNEPYHETINVTGLLQGTEKEILEQAAVLVKQGFTSLKVKVGSPDVEQDIKKILSLTKLYREKVLIHVDANKSWTLDQAKYFGNEVGCANIDYIEEPVKNFNDIPEFYDETTIPVALDETLIKSGIEEIKSIEGVELVILKPTVLGGIEKIWQISHRAKMVGITTVISSSFESGIGILTLANLAACLSRFTDAGLDTLKWFHQDLFSEKNLFPKGRLDINRPSPRFTDLNTTLLHEVDPE